ncbi:hypothetical protein niasHS_005993 [Heterodera schachtii]|uniref:B30.2/SPRY domain-containing protein n=1 Tax=Heterodera schachtii TaxID=97005 RepID=A0ABD2JN53_HETSC
MSFTPNSTNNGDFTSDQAVSPNLSRSEQLRVLRDIIMDLERTEQTMDSSNSTCIGEIKQNGNAFAGQFTKMQNDFSERIRKMEEQHREEKDKNGHILERISELAKQQQRNTYELKQFGTILAIISDQQKEQQQQIDQLSSAIQEKCAKIVATENLNEMEKDTSQRIGKIFEKFSLLDNFVGVLKDRFRKELLNAVHPANRVKICEKFMITQEYYWDANSCHNDLKIVDDKCLTIHYIGNGKAHRSVFAKYAIPSCDCGIFYFEIEIIHMKNCATIGLGTKAMPLDQRVGMHSDSYGCTTNGLFLMNGSFKNGKTKFSAGDIVGFGINLASGRIIFTKNGLPLDSTNWFVSPSAGDPLFACVSLHNSGDKIMANFGPHFKFDLASVEIFSNPNRNFLDANACHNRMQITGAESLMVFCKEGTAWNSVFAKYPISSCDSYIFYFETLIEKMGYVTIGLATKAMPLDEVVGNWDNSYGYHSYGSFYINNSARTYGSPKFSSGDIIGCGVIMDTGRIIFTKNGQIIDSSDLFISSFSSIADLLFPCFSLHNTGDTIRANFGPNFKFDISNVEECLSKQQKQNCWDANDRHSDLDIIGDKLSTINYKANGNAWRSAFTKYSWLSMNCDIFYFEIRVINVKSHLLIGFAPKQKSSLGGTVRNCIGTFAYEGDGTFWVNGAKINGNLTTKFTHGDIVGCGTHLETRQIIFTKNGKRLDTTNWLIPSPIDPLFPCVSLFDCGDKIEANFGPNFKFDLANI